MANLLRATPHVTIPGLLVPQTQNAIWKDYLGAKLSYGEYKDDYAYIPTISAMSSNTFVGQQWGKNLANQQYAIGQVQTAFYNIEAFVEWNYQEQEKFNGLIDGVALQDFLTNLAEQGINQKMHQAILYGFDNENNDTLGQGILSNATMGNLPQDSNKNTTLTAYNPSELLNWLISCARQITTNTYSLAQPVVIASSVRVVRLLQSILVPLTQFANSANLPGFNNSIGSLASVAGVYDAVVGGMLGVGKIKWVQDNLLLSPTADGNDTILFIAPEIKIQDEMGEDSSNLVGKKNSINYNTFFTSVGGGKQRFENTPNMGWYGFKMVAKTTAGVNLRQETVLQVPVKFS